MERSSKSFSYDPKALAAWVKSQPQPARCVYESGSCGFDLKRKLAAEYIACCIGAVTKMLRPSAERVKTDKRDATFLAHMLAVGDIVEVAVPPSSMEIARDLVRAREDYRHDIMRARHLLSKFLLRKGIVYDAGKSTWTKTYRT